MFTTNAIRLHTKHVTADGMAELLDRLDRCRGVAAQYDSQTGVLVLTLAPVPHIQSLFASMKCSGR